MFFTIPAIAAQRDNRIDLGSPARGDITSQQHNRRNQQRHRGGRTRVGGPDTIQQARHEAGKRDGGDQPAGKTGRGEQQSGSGKDQGRLVMEETLNGSEDGMWHATLRALTPDKPLHLESYSQNRVRARPD